MDFAAEINPPGSIYRVIFQHLAFSFRPVRISKNGMRDIARRVG
jgi:hypothetical protein